jgi:thiol-disulfide isomerase/thioredoxin
MTIVTRTGRGLNFLFIIAIVAIAFFAFHSFAQERPVKILYFFSPNCRHCADAKPYIEDLSKTYKVEGFRFGEGGTQLPFPTSAGDSKTAREKFGVAGYPTLVIVTDDTVRQKIAGMPDIKDAKTIIKGMENGALTVTEAVKNTGKKEFAVTGWLVARGMDMKHALFFLTDRTSEIQVKPWLPREALKSPVQRKGPRIMADVVRQALVLKGEFKKINNHDLFVVKEQLLLN